MELQNVVGNSRNFEDRNFEKQLNCICLLTFNLFIFFNFYELAMGLSKVCRHESSH